MAKKLNLAIIGQGRSGKDIHGSYYLNQANEYYNVKFVVEKNAQRREISKTRYEGCIVLEDYTQLFDYKDQIDVVVNASYSTDHFCVTKDLLEHGFNVLVEKPFTETVYQADVLIQTAKENGVKLAVFHNTLYAPYFEKAKEICANGVIGDILSINVKFNCFARRWDWQTLQKKLGGNVYNTGPHPIGFAVSLIDYDKNSRIAFAKLATTPMSSGDSDDFAKVIIDTPNKPLLDVEIHNNDAYSDYNVRIIGSKGTFQATPFAYKMKYIVDGENAVQPVQEEFLHDADYNPLYCKEQLISHEDTGNFAGTAFDIGTSELYKDLYFYLTENRQMKYTPENAKMIIGVISTMHALNPLEKKF